MEIILIIHNFIHRQSYNYIRWESYLILTIVHIARLYVIVESLTKKLFQISLVLPRPELERRWEHIINQIVQVVSLYELLSLIAWVHGHPAELVTGLFSLHEVPDWLPHHRHWLHVRKEKETARFIYFDSRPKELTCDWSDHNIQIKACPAP